MKRIILLLAIALLAVSCGNRYEVTYVVYYSADAKDTLTSIVRSLSHPTIVSRNGTNSINVAGGSLPDSPIATSAPIKMLSVKKL